MRRRVMALAVLSALLFSLSCPTALAAGYDDSKLETIRAIGIMTGDETGDLNLGSSVTRAEFVKMMSVASVYKDTVGSGYGYSLFRDVKNTHWASEYIKLAIDQGWVTGYVDGSFRPNNTITLEEACAALLRLLGYDSGSLAGSFPQAQLSKAASIGLLDEISATRGTVLTRQACATMFYHLLTAKTSSGAVYGATLGYTVTNGEVEYASLVSAATKGPYISTDGTLNLPFSSSNLAAYRNGNVATLSDVDQYDVYYYNANMNTVWIYSDRVSGTLTEVTPNRTAPTSATVAGKTYTVGTSSAAYALSSQGGYAYGSAVTLLLGMNGEVVGVLSAAESSGLYYGVVISSSKSTLETSTASTSGTSVQVATQVACSDGTARTFYHNGSTMSAGALVSVTMNKDGTTVKTLSDRTLSGTFNAAGTTFAGYSFANDAEILDTNEVGGFATIYAPRLGGVRLSDDDVRYYTLDKDGKIDRLILEKVTGDTETYGYMIKAQSNTDGMAASGTYRYLLNGQTYTMSGSTAHQISFGGVAITYSDGAVKSFRQLTAVSITELTDTAAIVKGKTYRLADNLQVLVRDSNSGDLFATTLSAINTSQYSLTGWYDDLNYSAGGQIRILVATLSSVS